MKVNEDLIILLKEDIFYRAKLFIDDMGEFAPFGSELINEEVKPVVIYDDSKEIFKGEELINPLMNDFSEKLKKDKIQAGAIAYDVIIKVNGESRNALCLIISEDGEFWSEDYYPYRIIDNECIWG